MFSDESHTSFKTVIVCNNGQIYECFSSQNDNGNFSQPQLVSIQLPPICAATPVTETTSCLFILCSDGHIYFFDGEDHECRLVSAFPDPRYLPIGLGSCVSDGEAVVAAIASNGVDTQVLIAKPTETPPDATPDRLVALASHRLVLPGVAAGVSVVSASQSAQASFHKKSKINVAVKIFMPLGTLERGMAMVHTRIVEFATPTSGPRTTAPCPTIAGANGMVTATAGTSQYAVVGTSKGGLFRVPNTGAPAPINISLKPMVDPSQPQQQAPAPPTNGFGMGRPAAGASAGASATVNPLEVAVTSVAAINPWAGAQPAATPATTTGFGNSYGRNTSMAPNRGAAAPAGSTDTILAAGITTTSNAMRRFWLLARGGTHEMDPFPLEWAIVNAVSGCQSAAGVHTVVAATDDSVDMSYVRFGIVAPNSAQATGGAAGFGAAAPAFGAAPAASGFGAPQNNAFGAANRGW